MPVSLIALGVISPPLPANGPSLAVTVVTVRKASGLGLLEVTAVTVVTPTHLEQPSSRLAAMAAPDGAERTAARAAWAARAVPVEASACSAYSALAVTAAQAELVVTAHPVVTAAMAVTAAVLIL
jgi:hypothetical protein